MEFFKGSLFSKRRCSIAVDFLEEKIAAPNKNENKYACGAKIDVEDTKQTIR